MKKKTLIIQALQEIQSKGDFARLHSFKEEASWAAMTADERNLLGMLFVSQGESLLENGDSKVLESFELASLAAPQNPEVFYRQALAYAKQKQNARCLTAADKALQAALTLNPSFIDAWHAWGNILVCLGHFHTDTGYFYDAHQKFSSALICSQNSDKTLSSEFYWHWGQCWHALSRVSGEACDLNHALEKYKQAAAHISQNHDFWNDYGNAVTDLARLVNKNELLFEAIELYRNAILDSPEQHQGWFNLACNYKNLFDVTREKSYFECAHEAFANAAKNCFDAADIWFNWGQLFADYGKERQDYEQLKLSLEKFEKAHNCDPDHYVILSAWAEALTLCGSNDESIEMLREAESKITKSVALNPDDSDVWYVYGACLTELGHYFENEKFYFDAIEKFRFGLSLDQSNPTLWYAVALAHYSIGELRNDVQMIEQSAHYCTRALEFGAQIFPQFWNDWGVALMKLAEMTHSQELLESAIEKFEQAISIYDKDFDEDFDPEWLYNYGCALDFLGDCTGDLKHYEKAVQALDKVLQIEPDYLQAHYNLALALSHIGEAVDDIESIRKSLEHFHAYLEMENEDESAWNEWGYALLCLADLMIDTLHPEHNSTLLLAAEGKFLQAVSLGCVSSFYHLACLYALSQNYSTAMNYLERAEKAKTLPSLEELQHDERLDNLRWTREFQAFLLKLQK